MSFRLLLVFAGLAVAPLAWAGGPSKAQIAAGDQLFHGSGCAHCHGENLQGSDVGPSLRDVGKRLKPDQITKQIHDGGMVMPAFGNVLSGDQIDQLVAFLRTQKAKTPRKNKPSAGL
jgi:cytochrome c551